MEGGKLVHSHSQPGGMDRTPPGTPKKGGKMLAVRVQMLDDSITIFQVQAKALGRVLFDQVCKQLHLLESDYFGLEYQELGGTKYWLDLEKPLSRQIGLSLVDTLVRFCVKFYTPDPSQLEEEFTRYLFCLQIKRDLAQGLLQCNDNTAALMASYIVQAECGDYVVEDYPDHRYLSTFKFVPNQDQELERRIMENHKKHTGQSPAEADLNLLETARRCELYGIKMHPAKDHEGVPLNLAVAHMGIVVFQNYTKINTFSWAKIRKISFKRKRFLVKLHPEGYGCYKDIVEFFFEGRNECKNFWKKCVENHGFFRCSMVKRVPRQKTRVLSRGSSFRYSGRTQKQVVEFVRENYVKRQTFQRSQSFRHSSSAHSSVANVGTSISAHPLLPLGDNAVAGTPASLSCGSMTLTSSPLHAADPHVGGSPSPPLTTSVSPGTSVTSSPQHFYPQETPYRRTGHPHSRLNHPQEHSHHTTSPLQSPTNVATTAAINRSASHSNNSNNNNGNLILDNDLKSSRVSLKNSDLMYFNDVYSNLYSSLRNLDYSNENLGKEDSAKTEISRHLPSTSKSNESVKSPANRSKWIMNKKSQNEDEHSWLRSSSCRNLYEQESLGNNVERFGYVDNSFKIGFDSPVTRYDDSRRGCYSAAASKTPSVDRTGEMISDTRIYSCSYPGTMSSLSTESVEGEPVIDINDSQDDVGLSHDDVSHDSYELLEKEFDDFVGEESNLAKRGRKFFENERARSCSWGSDKGEPQLESRSSEKIYGQVRPRENGFRSLERSKSPKHKSEMDFRSLERRSPKNSRSRVEGVRSGDRKYMTEYRKKARDYDGSMDMRRKSKEFDEVERINGRVLNMDDKSFIMTCDESWRSQPFRREDEEEKKFERKREKREKDDRFHEGFEQKNLERSLFLDKDEQNGKLERVFSNQFGKYPEFLGYSPDYELLKQERKVSENYEKVCQVGKIAKELERNEKALSERLLRKSEQELSKDPVKKPFRMGQFSEYSPKTRGGTVIGFSSSPKAPIERTKSDPYDTTKNLKRNVLTHQKSIDLTPQDSAEVTSDYDNDDGRKTSRSEHDIPYILRKRHFMNGTAKDSDIKKELDKPGKINVEIINLDVKDEKNLVIQGKRTKPAIPKKPVLTTEKKQPVKVIPKNEPEEVKKDDEEDLDEPIYAQVVKGKIVDAVVEKKKTPPEPPKRTTSVPKIEDIKKDQPKPPKRTSSLPKKTPPEPPKRTTSVQKKTLEEETEPTQKSKAEFMGIAHKREELFARTRLGLSEGSAFTPVTKHVDSPSSQRRTKSLDAPIVSVHRLPPADAFSSKDDTVDEGDDVINYVRSAESSSKVDPLKSSKAESLIDTTISTESEMDVFLPDEGDIDKNFKETVESQSKFEVIYPEEKVLDSVRNKRLLSKIDSMDSEGDLDSSRKAEPIPIPSDRMVNLPESVRFPSVRQISGQTSEESADGWEQREVKIKRRTPRRSVGREEQDVGLKESVVWDSKDDEPPDDDVWDSDAVFTVKSQTKTDPEYLKRGSCGQSIDDDNVSTPMKESSPEHWVSVDDLPEAIEREERFLREQEKILREKILNEKIKRELNLDPIEIDRRLQNTECSRDKFKGHSLDTYELTEKRLRERGTKNCSLDEHILRQSPIKTYLSIGSDLSDKSSSYENVPKKTKGHPEFIKVVNSVNEIDQFGDNDEELEEFVVVLDEGLNGKESRDVVWDDVSFRRSLSKEESLISVPEEFKDAEEDDVDKSVPHHKVEITLEGKALGKKVQDSSEDVAPVKDEKRAADDNGRLSPYDSASRRGSDDPRRGSASDDAGRLSPYDESRRGSEDPRRLSTSEDSKHYSISESVSEETRRRLSSTEETRRKRASLTKQCSVGVDSLSDDIIPGIQECSSSFEQDEKDVFESVNEPLPKLPSSVPIGKLEIEVSEDTDTKDSGIEDEREDMKDTGNHLAPPTGERELSRETEDSVDYGEGDFKEIRETVKEKDISDGFICDNESVKSGQHSEGTPSSFEKSELSEHEDLRFIDDKRGSTPEILIGKTKETASISVVVVNEGISVLNKIIEREKSRTLPKMALATGSTSTDSETTSEEQRHTLPKAGMKPKLSPKPDYIHRKLTKAVPNMKVKPPAPCSPFETSQESSQDSDVDRLTEVSLLAQIQSQIARRNLTDTGKRLRRETVEMHDEDGIDRKDRQAKAEEKSPEQEKRDSGEDVSSSSSAPPHPKRELSSTWRPFLLESSGSSSLEEGWLPPDDNAHLADEEETSSNSNNQQDDSIHEDIDYPSGYPVLNLSSAEMMVGGYTSVFALSRTLSRISERSTSEQERSDAEDDITKPSSHSVSIEEESIISSDHQPSLSSDSPSPKAGASNIPELPHDRSPIPDNFLLPEDKMEHNEPFSGIIPPPMTDEDWPSPPSSSSVFDTPVVSHIETFYMEIQPQEACRVVVTDKNDDNSSSDENQTLQEEGELLHLSSDNLSLSTTTTTQDGTVIIPVHPSNVRTNSVSEDTSIISTSDWSNSTTIRNRTNSNFGTTEDLSDWTKCSTVPNGKYKQIGSSEELSDWIGSAKKQSPMYSKSDDISSENLGSRSETWQCRSGDTSHIGSVSSWSTSSSKYSPEEQESPKSKVPKTRPPKLKSPPSKNMGFFETPISKVRSPTSQLKFFERPEKNHTNNRSPTSRSESASPKNHGRFFDVPPPVYHTLDYYDLQKAPTSVRAHGEESGRKNACIPYYSNVADKAEKSYYGQYDTGSLERTKIQPSRKSISYHSVVRARPNEEDASSNDAQSPPPTSNTIPRASKKSRRRHRVALDIQIRDGKIVAPPKTRTTVLDNSDSDRSSPSFSSRQKESDM